MTVRAEIVIQRAGLEWESQQVEEPCILPNPKVPGRLIMFYSGVSRSNKAVAAIGKAWALASDPFTWQQDEANPIFGPGRQGWDAGTIRLDCVLYIPEEDAYYIYYSGTTGTVQDRIGLAICPAGDDGYSGVTAGAITRFGDGPVLAPEPAEPYCETMASQAAVLREWNADEARWDWTMFYSYRGKDGTLPGIRLATSRDGKTWVRQFNARDPRGMGQIFASTPSAYYEWHQVFRLDQTYVLCIEVGPEHGKRWRPVIAVSRDPRSGWEQLGIDALLQTHWEGLGEDECLYHVATPALYCTVPVVPVCAGVQAARQRELYRWGMGSVVHRLRGIRAVVARLRGHSGAADGRLSDMPSFLEEVVNCNPRGLRTTLPEVRIHPPGGGR